MKGSAFETGGKRSSDRHSWADLCRVVAVFGVILIHACGASFYQFGKIPKPDWLAASFLDSIVRCAVPLFVMLSGALILRVDSEETEFRQIFQRVSKVLLPLLTWNAVYLLYVSHFTGEPVKWLGMLTRPAMYHLWFVYMIIGIYVLLPIFRAIFHLVVCRANLQVYFLALWLIVTCVPIYQPVSLISHLQQPSLFGYGGYFLIGGVLAVSGHDRMPSAVWWLIYVAGVAVTFALTVTLSEQAQAAVETAYLYFSPNVFVSSVAAFVLLSRVRIAGRLGSLLQWISDRSFLIYLMHVVVLEHMSNATSTKLPWLPAGLSIVATALATFLVCLAAAAALRLLPSSRALLG